MAEPSRPVRCPLQARPRLPERGALLRLPGEHVLQPVPAVEVAGEVGRGGRGLVMSWGWSLVMSQGAGQIHTALPNHSLLAAE